MHYDWQCLLKHLIGNSNTHFKGVLVSVSTNAIIILLCSIYTDTFDDADKKVNSIDRLVRSNIPLHAVFSGICDRAWMKVLARCRMITRSNIWSSLRRELLAALDSMEPNLNLDMIAVLTDSTYRKYFDRFIRSNPAGKMFF